MHPDLFPNGYPNNPETLKGRFCSVFKLISQNYTELQCITVYYSEIYLNNGIRIIAIYSINCQTILTIYIISCQSC